MTIDSTLRPRPPLPLLAALGTFAVLGAFACDAPAPQAAPGVVHDTTEVAAPPADSLLLDSLALADAVAGRAPGVDAAPGAAIDSVAAAALEGARITPGRAVGPEDFEVGVTPVDPSKRAPRPEHVRALYVNAWSAGSSARMNALIGIANRTEINTFVVDIKEADGQVTYRSSIPMVRRVGANTMLPIRDVNGLLARLRENGIYPIARIVVFKDPVLATARPDWAIRTAEEQIWRDHNREVWVDPYNANVWEYNLALAREAVALGFAEVQWDYVRFPDVPAAYMRTAVYAAREGRSRAEAIREFLRYTREELAPAGVPVTADVFGVTTSASHDVGIGQHWESMSDVTDVLLPMVYPSHYPRGSFGIRHPNADPYHTVLTALRHAVRRNRVIENPAIIRPWLQDFTLGAPPYGPAHVRAQIRAVYDAGLDEWVLWNASSRYTVGALADAEGDVPHIEGLAELITRADTTVVPPDTIGIPEAPPLPDDTAPEKQPLGTPMEKAL